MTDNPLTADTAKYKHPVYYILLLAIIACVAWWPISFHVFSLKNDALNYFLPVRKLVSESYHEGILPAWTPYLNLGYPLHGDMQSGVWNPVVQLLSLFGPYTLLTLQIETLLYVLLSGAGMFYLLRYFRVHPFVNLAAASAYMLCGFNSDSAQFLNWIAGASFLPFVFLFYYRCLAERKIYWAVASAISLYFYFVCAYPADFIILLYVLAALLTWYGIRSKAFVKETIGNKTFWLTHLTLLATFLILCLPAILSFYENLPLTERGNGATYDEVMSNPLHPALLSSYFYPASAWKMPAVAITDPLERNSFFGILLFTFFIAALFSKPLSKLSWFYKIAVLLFFLFSLGEIGGIRIVSYYILPLMDSFRHPANAKLFTIFFSCLLAAEFFQHQLESDSLLPAFKKAFYVVCGLMLLVFVISLFTPLKLFSLFSSAGNTTSLADLVRLKIEQLTYADTVLICLLIQIPFLVLGWKWLRQKKYRLLASLSVLNSVIFCMLMQPLTVVKNQKASGVQAFIDKNSRTGYPLPDLTTTLIQNSIDNETFFSQIGCLNLYNKKIGRSDYRITPSNLLLQNKFWFTDSVRNIAMQQPFLYSAGNKEAVIQLTRFNPLVIEGMINATKDEVIVLSQTSHPRWQLFVDGQKQEIKNVHIAFMSFELPAGEHSFKFEYRATDLKLLWLISTAMLLLSLLYLFFYRKRSFNRLTLHSR
jgi:hypothetical protein